MEIRCVSYVSFQPIFYMIYVLYIHIYIYVSIVGEFNHHLQVPGLPYPAGFWGSTTRAERACSGLGQCQGWFVHHGTLIEACHETRYAEMYGWRKQQKNMEMLFWVQGVWDGVKLGENLMCGRVVTFLCWRWLAGRNLICVWRWMGHPTIISYNFIYVRYPWSSSQASSCQYLEDEGMLNIQFHPNDFASQWARCHFC